MNSFLRRLPSTNFRIFVAVLLAVILVFYAMVGQVVEGWTEKDVLMDEDYFATLRNFVLAVMGLDVVQFVSKRMTHKEGVGEDEVTDDPREERA